MNQKLSPGQHQKTRKLGWGVTFLLILSAFINFAFFAIAFGSFLAVGLNLEGPFRFRIFWLPIPRWLIWVMLIVVFSNVIFWVVAYLFAITMRFRQSKKAEQGQGRPPMLWFPSRWKMIWYGGGLFLIAIASPLFSASNLSVPQGKTELVSIAMVSPTEGWATGDQLLHFQHGTWSPFSQSTPFEAPFKVVMNSSNEGWGVISDQVIHYTQGTWQQVDTSSISSYLSNMEDIALVPGSSSEGWMVGAGAISDTNTTPTPTILHMKNGIWNIFPL